MFMREVVPPLFVFYGVYPRDECNTQGGIKLRYGGGVLGLERRRQLGLHLGSSISFSSL